MMDGLFFGLMNHSHPNTYAKVKTKNIFVYPVTARISCFPKNVPEGGAIALNHPSPTLRKETNFFTES